MSEYVTPQEQRYPQVILDYTAALEHGDIEIVAVILHEAEQDPILEQMLLAANIVYQKNNRIAIRSGEVKQAQAVLLNAFSSLEGEPINIQKGKKQLMQTQQTSIQQEKLILLHTSMPTRLRRFSALAQTFVAVLVVGLLVSGFMLLFASRHMATTTSSGLSGTSGHTVLSHSIVVTSTDDGTVYGMRPDTGAIAWHYATGKSVFGRYSNNTLAVQGQVVYYANNGQLYALRVTNGTLLWHKDLTFPGSKDMQNSYTKIMVEQGIVFVSGEIQGIGLPGGSMYALRERDGAVIWHYWCDRNSLLAVHNGVVYVQKSVSNENLQALRVSDGSVLWSYKTPVMAVAADDTTLYVYSAHTPDIGNTGSNKEHKMLHALSTKGTLLWSRPIVDEAGNLLVLAQGKLIVGKINKSNIQICAYQTTNGSQVWCTPNEAEPFTVDISAFTTLDSTLYSDSPIMSGDGEVIRIDAYNISNGSLRWSSRVVENFVLNKLVVMNKMVYVVGYHRVYALDDSNGRIHWQLLNTENTFASIAVGSW